MFFHRITVAAMAVMALGGTAHASTIVDIDSQTYGCDFPQCSGPQNSLPGTVVSFSGFPKLQLTLGPGTYTITNNNPGGYYSAWNFEGYPTTGNWVWSFDVANDATSTVLMDDYVEGVYGTQAAAAGATGIATYDGNTTLTGTSTAGFVDTLTLSSTTTLDFFIDDYDLGDNGGGVELSISGGSSSVPEPSSLVLLGVGLFGLRALRFRARARQSDQPNCNSGGNGKHLDYRTPRRVPTQATGCIVLPVGGPTN